MSVESLSWWGADHERWAALDYVETLDDDGFRTDGNRETRKAVLRMLTQDHTSADADFLRHLVRQETAMHAASWGYGDSLGLAALRRPPWTPRSDILGRAARVG